MSIGDYSRQLTLYWLWFIGLIAGVVAMLHDQGLIIEMIAVDRTRLSIFILLMFAALLLHGGWRCIFLDRQRQLLLPDTEGLAFSDLTLFSRSTKTKFNPEQQMQAELLGERLHGQHRVGWFFTGLLIKLGLLGTVIGFVVMLSSITAVESLEISQIQLLMQTMTGGMRIALNTTIFGLVCSMLAGLQYLMLDRSADRLLADVVQHNSLAEA